jgi:branched-chain amino acid transport system ATP-binding protein
MAPILTIEQLSVAFDGIVAVDAVDMALEPGEIRGLIGPNGAGKTTLFNAISGLAAPSGGRILFCGADVTVLPAHTRAALGIRRTFQTVQLVRNFTVYENLLTALHAQIPYDVPRLVLGITRNRSVEADIAQRIAEVLHYFGIEDIASREVRSLTVAQQRFVEMAQSLVARPKLVMFDEPAAGLTPPQVEEIERLLLKLAKDGVTVLLVEHLVSLVLKVCDRVTVLDRGKVIAEGAGQAVMENVAVKEAYLGKDLDA